MRRQHYSVHARNNKLTIIVHDAKKDILLPYGYYTFEQYISMLEAKLRLVTPLVSVDVTDKYVQFNFQQPVKFVRSESTLDGWFNDINHFFETCDGKTTANGMYYQRICRQGVRYCDGTTKYTFNNTQFQVYLEGALNIRTTINIESTQQVFSNDYSIASGDYSFVSIAQRIVDNVNTLYSETMLSGTAKNNLYKVNLLFPEATIQFDDNCDGLFLDFINLPRIVNASNDSFIMGAFVGNGWFTGSITIPEGTQFTIIRQDEAESGIDPHTFTFTRSFACKNGGASGLLSYIRGLISNYYKNLGGDVAFTSFLIYGKAHCSCIRAGGSYGVFKFGRVLKGSPELLDYVTLPETFLSSEWNVFNKVNPTITLPEGYYTPEEECSFVKSRIESLPVWGQVINGATWSILFPTRIQRSCSETCCSLTSINPLWLVNESSGQVFNTGLYTNVNLQFMNSYDLVLTESNNEIIVKKDDENYTLTLTPQPTTQQKVIEDINCFFHTLPK